MTISHVVTQCRNIRTKSLREIDLGDYRIVKSTISKTNLEAPMHLCRMKFTKMTIFKAPGIVKNSNFRTSRSPKMISPKI